MAYVSSASGGAFAWANNGDVRQGHLDAGYWSDTSWSSATNIANPGIPAGCTAGRSYVMVYVWEPGNFRLYYNTNTIPVIGSWTGYMNSPGFLGEFYWGVGNNYVNVTGWTGSIRLGFDKYRTDGSSDNFRGNGLNTSLPMPTIAHEYGYNLTGLTSANSSIRYLRGDWNATPGVIGWDVYKDGVYQGRTGSTAIGYTVTVGSHSLAIYPVYSGTYFGAYEFTTAGQSFSISISGGTPSTTGTSLQSNTPHRRKIRVTLPTVGTHHSNVSWDIQINNAANNTAVTSVNGVAGGATDVTIPTPWTESIYNIYYRARWTSSSDVSSFAHLGTANADTPTITGASATTSLERAMTVTWNQITDITSYSVALDSYSAVSIPQTPNTTGSGTVPSTSIAYNYTIGTDGTTCAVTFSNIRGQAHTATIIPVQTGYTGPTNNGNVSGGAVIPTPGAPSILGNVPQYRQIQVTPPATMGLTTPASFFNASSWDGRVTGDDTSITNSTSNVFNISQVAQGSRSAQIRARWADGDVSGWSVASNSVTIITPAPDAVSAKQRSAPTTAPAITASDTGGTLEASTYYIATSVNKSGSKSTDAEHPEAARPVNESTPSPLAEAVITTNTGSIQVPKPANCTGSDTWNVYVGKDRNALMRGRGSSPSIKENLSSATATSTITSYTFEGTNQAKVGKVDIQFSPPTSVGDAPVSYKVERVPMNGTDPATGTPGSTWIDTSTRIGLQGIFGTTPKRYWENNIDTKYYFFRISAVYSNDTSSPVEVVV